MKQKRPNTLRLRELECSRVCVCVCTYTGAGIIYFNQHQNAKVSPINFTQIIDDFNGKSKQGLPVQVNYFHLKTKLDYIIFPHNII